MQTIPNVSTAAGYTDACTLEDPNAVAATYIVANAAVYAQFRQKRSDGTLGPYGPELLLSPQSNNMALVGGMRFRDAVPGVHAQVIAAMYDRDDPLPGAATPFSQTIAASGSVTPGVSAVQIQLNGGLVGAEPTIDFIAGLGVDLVAADDPANTRVTLSIASGAKKIVRAVLGGPVGSITFSGLPTTYDALYAVLAVQNDTAADQTVLMRLNGDSAAHYRWQLVYGQGVSAAGLWDGGGLVTSGVVGHCPSSALGWFSPIDVLLPGYGSLNSTTWRTSTGHLGGSFVAGGGGGLWTPTGSVTSVTFLPSAGNFNTGSAITLYGFSS